jgi:hypothetical protein
VLQNFVSAPFIANQFEFTVDSIRNPGNMAGFSNPIMVLPQNPMIQSLQSTFSYLKLTEASLLAVAKLSKTCV